MTDFSKDISKFKESFVNEGPNSIGTDLDAGNTVFWAKDSPLFLADS